MEINWLEQGKKLFESQQWDAAVAAFAEARNQNPQNAAAVSSLAAALLRVGRIEEAETCAREAVALNPLRAASWANLGACLFEQQRWGEAADAFREATTQEPRLAAHWSNLGEAEQRLGLWTAAQTSFERGLAINLADVNARLGQASVMAQQGNVEAAFLLTRQILTQFPQYAAAWLAAGKLLTSENRYPEAIEMLRRARQLAPGRFEILYNLARTLSANGDVAEAEQLACDLVRDFPKNAGGWSLLGMIQQQDLGQFVVAEATHRRAIEINPHNVDAHWNLALLKLLQGEFDEGWREYEWRWRRITVEQAARTEPRWNGEELFGKTILIHSEQGLGDTLQFVRYLPLLKARGATVIFEGPRSLKSVLSRLPIDHYVAPATSYPGCDFQLPLLSLPPLVTSPFDFLAGSVPYLYPAADLVDHWRGRFAAIKGMKVGIAWQGNPRHQSDKDRSIPLAHFEVLAKVPGVCLISLQKENGLEQLEGCIWKDKVVLLGNSLDEAAGAFMDTAAVMSQLDLVITCDTAIAHLAGALGVPVWVALPRIPDWRWFLEREDSPWYPTMRLFRQATRGDWSSVFETMADQLGGLAVAAE